MTKHDQKIHWKRSPSSYAIILNQTVSKIVICDDDNIMLGLWKGRVVVNTTLLNEWYVY